MVKRGLAFGGILAILSSVGIYNNIYATETGSTKFSVDINNAVLELTVPSSPAVIDLNPTMTNASFGSTSINVHVATNNITGYTLTMTPTNNTEATSLIRTELIGDEQNYREIETLELTDPVSTGYTEQSFTTNKWGYKITGDNYYGIDPENTTISHPAWVTDAPTNETRHNLTLAAKVDAETVAGSYETTLNFRAVTNAVVAKHTISFNANGGTGTMESIVVTAGDTVQLPLCTFIPPEGYRFSGWATTQTGLGTGVRYFDDGAEYTAIDNGVNQSVVLYAQWTLNTTPVSPTPAGVTGTTFQRAYEIAYTAMKKGMYELTGPGSTHYEVVDSWNETSPEQYKNLDVRFAMQDMTPDICASVTVMHDDYQALDVRDDKLYHITKLQDGNCWMTQNLDFDIPTTELSSMTTDLNIYGENGYDSDRGYRKEDEIIYFTPIRNTIHTTTALVPGWVTTFSASYSADMGDYYFNNDIPGSYVQCNFLEQIQDCNNEFATMPYNINGTHGHVGNLYNFNAAVALNDVSAPLHHAMENSICPSGWRLPNVKFDVSFSGGYRSELLEMSILEALNGSALLKAPFYTTHVGNIYGNNKLISGAGGSFHTNYSRYSNTNINFSNNNFDFETSRNTGVSIRCIAR